MGYFRIAGVFPHDQQNDLQFEPQWAMDGGRAKGQKHLCFRNHDTGAGHERFLCVLAGGPTHGRVGKGLFNSAAISVQWRAFGLNQRGGGRQKGSSAYVFQNPVSRCPGMSKYVRLAGGLLRYLGFDSTHGRPPRGWSGAVLILVWGD